MIFVLVMNKATGQRVEAAEANFWAAMMDGMSRLPGNPYRMEVRRFGSVVAMACPGMPSSGLTNRIMLAGPGQEAELAEAVAFMTGKGIRCRIDVTPFHQNGDFLKHLAREGFYHLGFQMALYGEAVPFVPERTPGVELKVCESADDVETAAQLYPLGFEMTGAWVGFMSDSVRAVAGLPGWTIYLALVDGEPAGTGLLYQAERAGVLAGAATLPYFRGRGAQKALIHRRIADAAAAGCDLICSQTGNGTVSQNNMEKAGLRIAYTKAEFYNAIG